MSTLSDQIKMSISYLKTLVYIAQSMPYDRSYHYKIEIIKTMDRINQLKDELNNINKEYELKLVS